MLSTPYRLVAGAVLAICSAAPVQAETYQGHAYGASLSAPLLPNITFAHSGNLPPGGGTLSSFLLNANATIASQTLASGTMNVSTTGGSGTVTSVARTEGLDVGLHVGLVDAVITATVVQATSTVLCGAPTGATVITDLRINNVAVTVTGQPNQVIGIPGVATVTLNEQILNQTGSTTELTVNAIHIRVLVSLVEIIVSQANAGVSECESVGVTTSQWSAVKGLYR